MAIGDWLQEQYQKRKDQVKNLFTKAASVALPGVSAVPKIQTGLKKAVDIGEQILPETFRAPARFGGSIIQGAANDFDFTKPYTPSSRLEKTVFGDKPFSMQSEGSDLLRAFGGSEETGNKYGVAAGFLVGSLDLLPGGGGAKKAFDNIGTIANRLSKADDPIKTMKIVEKELSFLDDVTKKEIAESYSKVADRFEIESDLSRRISQKIKGDYDARIARQTEPESIDSAAQTLKSSDSVPSPKTAEALRREADEYIESQIARQREATAKEATGARKWLQEKVNDFGTKFVDFTFPITRPLESYLKQTGTKLSESENIQNAISRVLRAPVLAEQFKRDIGLEDIAKSLPANDYDKFNQYLIARHNVFLDSRGIEKGRDIAKDLAIIDAYKDQFELLAKRVTDASEKVLDMITEKGLISKDLSNHLKAIYPNYVPLNVLIDESDDIFTGIGKGVASLSKQSVVNKITGSNRAVANPLESLSQKIDRAMYQAEKNRAAQILTDYRNLPGNPLGIRALDTIDDIVERKRLIKDMAEMKVVKEESKELIQKHRKSLGTLRREIKNLENKAVQTVKKDIPKNWNDIPDNYIILPNGQSRSVRELLKREFGDVATLMSDIKTGGYSLLNEVYGVPLPVAKKLAQQFFDNPMLVNAGQFADEFQALIDAKSLDDFAEGVMAMPSQMLKRIGEMLDTRHSQVFNLLDDVSKLQVKVDEAISKNIDNYEALGQLKKGRVKDGEDTITVLRDGVKETYAAPKEIAAAAKNLNSEQLNSWLRIATLPNRVRRLTITGISAPFVLANLAKDTLTSFIFGNTSLKNSVLNPEILLGALKSSAKANILGKVDDEYTSLVRSGGGGSFFQSGRDQIKESFASAASKRNIGSRVKYLVSHPSELLQTVEDMFATTENAVRLASFRGTRRELMAQGMSAKEATEAAGRAARENTVDFFRRGEYGSVLNAIFMYLNAGIQGTRAMVRAAQRNPKRFATRLGMTLGLPAVTLTLWNTATPERKRAYEDISASEKESNLIILPPNPTKDDDGKWNAIKIPIQTGVNGYMNVVRAATERLRDVDQVTASDIFRSLTGIVSPVEPTPRGIALLGASTPLGPAAEAYTNYSVFRDRGIEPESFETRNLSPEMRYDDRTSGTFKKIGEATNTSPMKLEYLAQGYFGAVGQNVTNLVDRALAAVGVIGEDEIGGKELLQSIKGRFYGAYGGQTEREAVKEGKEALREQEDEKQITKNQAKKELDKIKAMEKSARKPYLQQLLQTDKALAEKVISQIEDAQYDYSAEERVIRDLDVKNGARAKYVVEKLLDMEPEDRKTYLSNLVERKVVSQDVLKQIIAVINMDSED